MKPLPILCLSLIGLLLATPAQARTVRVVTTTPSLADITRQVGGEFVTVESIMRGNENPHNVTPKPSFIMKVRKADLFVHCGLDGEPWVPQLLKGTRNMRLHPGHEGNVDVSPGIVLKEVPQRGQLTRAEGDIHVFGNPHYMLDPLNGIVVARNIAAALARADPAHAADFERNDERFAQAIAELTARLLEEMAPWEGTPVVTYHRTWPYFLDRFGLVAVAEVEPKPGIAPGPGSLGALVETMKASGARIVIVEPYNSLANAEFVAKRADGVALVLATEVSGAPGVDSYQVLFEHDVRALIDAFTKAGVTPRDTVAPPTGDGASPAPAGKGA